MIVSRDRSRASCQGFVVFETVISYSDSFACFCMETTAVVWFEHYLYWTRTSPEAKIDTDTDLRRKGLDLPDWLGQQNRCYFDTAMWWHGFEKDNTDKQISWFVTM